MENVYESLHEVRDHCRGASLSGCLVQRVDLSVLSFEEYLLDGVSFKSVGLGSVSFLKAMLHQVSFNGAQLRDATFTTAQVRGCNFFASELIQTQFVGALLEQVRFYDSRLSNANFGGARMLDCKFNGTDLYGARFDRAMIMHSTFSDPRMDNAQLSGVNFAGAVLVDVDLNAANLYGANFSNALLVKCDLRDANLVSCNFEGAQLLDVALDRADIDEDTRAAITRARRTDLRNDLRQQERIQEALSQYRAGELADMMAQICKAYVIDGVTPMKPDVGRVHVPQTLRGLDFASLIETLKFHLDLPDLEKRNVVDGVVFVKLGSSEYPLDDSAAAPPVRAAATPPARPTPPAAPADTPAAPAPTPAAPPNRSPLAAELDNPPPRSNEPAPCFSIRVAVLLLLPLVAHAGDKDDIIRLVQDAQRAGFERHDLDGYMAMWAKDATLVGHRVRGGDAHDFTLTYAQIQATKRLHFTGRARGLFLGFTDVRVRVEGAKATLTWLATISADGKVLEKVHETYLMRRTKAGWRCVRNSYYLVDNTKERIAALDAEYERAKAGGDPLAVFTAARKAGRHADARAAARTLRAAKTTSGNTLLEIAFLALQLGEAQEAIAIAKEAIARDPGGYQPEWAK